jgi:hypothetical protein
MQDQSHAYYLFCEGDDLSRVAVEEVDYQNAYHQVVEVVGDDHQICHYRVGAACLDV